MKKILVTMMMVFSATAFAVPKKQSCDAYMEAAFGNAPPHVRLELGLKAMAAVVEVHLTPAQESKILSNVINFISKHPKKQDDFEGMFYFACTTDLDAEEKEQLRDQLLKFEEL